MFAELAVSLSRAVRDTAATCCDLHIRVAHGATSHSQAKSSFRARRPITVTIDSHMSAAISIFFWRDIQPPGSARAPPAPAFRTRGGAFRVTERTTNRVSDPDGARLSAHCHPRSREERQHVTDNDFARIRRNRRDSCPLVPSPVADLASVWPVGRDISTQSSSGGSLLGQWSKH